MGSNHKYVLLGATALLLSAPVHAQQASTDAGTNASDATAPDTGPAEIIVTAQRRAENIQKVPISINQFSGDRMEQLSIKNSNDLQFVTPGLNFQEESAASQISLRGVGTAYSGPGLEGSVAVYLDGAYIASQIGAAENFLDIRQVQVLKGPQGALYGRNATGGAVLIDTNDPTTDSISGRVKVGYGNLNWIRSEGVVNLPLGEKAALRVAGAYQQRDGYVLNESTGKKIGDFDTYAVRAKLLLEPTETLRIVGKVEYSQRNFGENLRREIAPGLICRFCNSAGVALTTDFYHVNQTSNDVQLGSLGSKRDLVRGNGDLANNILTTNIVATLDIGVVTLKSVTGYRQVRQRGANDQDASPLNSLFSFHANDGINYKSFNQDMQLLSDTKGAFDFSAGVSYERDTNRFQLGLAGNLFGGLVPVTDNRDRTTAYSAFGEIYYRFLDGFTLTLGGRFTRDERTHTFFNDADAQLVFVEASGTAKAHFNSFTPRAVLSYDAGNANYYVSFNRGFKAGGFNSPGYNSSAAVAPERITAYEIGAKYSLLDRRLRLNFAAFHYDWNNLQIGFINTAEGGIIQQNAASATNDGFEATVEVTPLDGLNLNLTGLYQNSRFSSFPTAAVLIPSYLITPGTLGQVAGAEDVRGFHTPNAPALSGSASVNYRFGLGQSGWTSEFTGNVSYKGAYDMAAGAGGPARLARDDGYAVANARLAVTSPSEMTTVEIWGDNLTQTKYYFNIIGTTDGAYGSQAMPRTFGVAVTQKF